MLWLPESKLDSWFIRDGILVVNGDADLLIESLKQFDALVRKPTRVRFPRDPGRSYTKFLLRRGYVYDGGNFCWNGADNEVYFKTLPLVLKDADGRAERIWRV